MKQTYQELEQRLEESESRNEELTNLNKILQKEINDARPRANAEENIDSDLCHCNKANQIRELEATIHKYESQMEVMSNQVEQLPNENAQLQQALAKAGNTAEECYTEGYDRDVWEEAKEPSFDETFPILSVFQKLARKFHLKFHRIMSGVFRY